jgi:hypothetical protein
MSYRKRLLLVSFLLFAAAAGEPTSRPAAQWKLRDGAPPELQWVIDHQDEIRAAEVERLRALIENHRERIKRISETTPKSKTIAELRKQIAQWTTQIGQTRDTQLLIVPALDTETLQAGDIGRLGDAVGKVRRVVDANSAVVELVFNRPRVATNSSPYFLPDDGVPRGSATVYVVGPDTARMIDGRELKKTPDLYICDGPLGDDAKKLGLYAMPTIARVRPFAMDAFERVTATAATQASQPATTPTPPVPPAVR